MSKIKFLAALLLIASVSAPVLAQSQSNTVQDSTQPNFCSRYRPC